MYNSQKIIALFVVLILFIVYYNKKEAITTIDDLSEVQFDKDKKTDEFIKKFLNSPIFTSDGYQHDRKIYKGSYGNVDAYVYPPDQFGHRMYNIHKSLPDINGQKPFFLEENSGIYLPNSKLYWKV